MKTTIDDQPIEETVTAKWSDDKNAVFYEGEGVSFTAGTPLTSSAIFGWDGSKGLVIERNFNSVGGTLASTHS